jgi:hypothetical protein
MTWEDNLDLIHGMQEMDIDPLGMLYIESLEE